jgi:hypothetical protein
MDASDHRLPVARLVVSHGGGNPHVRTAAARTSRERGSSISAGRHACARLSAGGDERDARTDGGRPDALIWCMHASLAASLVWSCVFAGDVLFQGVTLLEALCVMKCAHENYWRPEPDALIVDVSSTGFVFVCSFRKQNLSSDGCADKNWQVTVGCMREDNPVGWLCTCFKRESITWIRQWAVKFEVKKSQTTYNLERN